MKPIILIPARLGANRFPNKPLADIDGKPMIVHVMERALEADLGPVVVACCGNEIADIVTSYGGHAILTDPNLPSGTDRIQEALQKMDPQGTYDVVVNLQGDLPTISPVYIQKVVHPLNHSQVDMATLAAPLKEEEIDNPNAVKVVLAHTGQALYFSRLPVPYEATQRYHHIGIYAFRRNILNQYVKLSPSPLEKCERLEQLRLLEAGYRVDVALVDTFPQSVDTPQDLEIVRKLVNCREVA